MNLGELINQAFIKAGVSSDNDYLKKLLSNAELAKEQVPDEVAVTLNNLITIESAKVNPDVKRHFYGAALTPVEKEINDIMIAYEFSEEDINSIKGINSTFAKLPALKDKLDSFIQKKTNASSPDKAKYAEEIVRLNAQIAEIKKAESDRVMNVQRDYEGKLLDMNIRNLFGGYSYTDAIPKDVAILTAINLFNQNTNQKGAKLKLVDGNLKLVRSDDESLPYLENNVEVSVNSFADKLIADNKLLKVSPVAPAPANGKISAPDNGKLSAGTMSILDKQLNQLKGN